MSGNASQRQDDRKSKEIPEAGEEENGSGPVEKAGKRFHLDHTGRRKLGNGFGNAAGQLGTKAGSKGGLRQDVQFQPFRIDETQTEIRPVSSAYRWQPGRKARIDNKHCNVQMRILHSCILPVDEPDLLCTICVVHKQEVIRNRVNMTKLEALRLFVDESLQTENRPFRFIVIRINGRFAFPKALVKIQTLPQIKAVRNMQPV